MHSPAASLPSSSISISISIPPSSSSSSLSSSCYRNSRRSARALPFLCRRPSVTANGRCPSAPLFLSPRTRRAREPGYIAGILPALPARNRRLRLRAAFDDVDGTSSSGFDELEREEASANANGGGAIVRTLQLGLMFATWNLFNIYFNIFNKQVLKAYPFPITMTAFQFGMGTFLIVLMWASNLHERPKVSPSQLLVILPLAMVHTLGNLFTNLSLLKVNVSFTHTVKAMEPFFSVLLSALFLGENPSILVLATLVPIVGGVALASFTEVSFNWIGFWSAMASNLTNQSRNVFSKKLMSKKEETLDTINLFSIITIMSFLLSTPIMLFTEGITFTPSHLLHFGLDAREIYTRCLLMGLCFHAYQQAGYMLLERISPVSHSVGNCVKRVVVIVSSVLFFKTPVSLINSFGTGLALAGVFLYSRVKKSKTKSE